MASLLLKPDLIAIDHGHFQYNSLIIGLILGAFYCLLNRNYYICCVLFTIAVHSKQMAVYYALAFLAGLIGRVLTDYKTDKIRILKEIIIFAFIVLTVSLIIWLPFILTGSAHYVLEAIFPVHRGLYQLKVQNFWCISDVFMNW
jgi:alpha-1,3-glucosyltransferase